MTEDKNFDGLAKRFQKKVYGGLKGDIRLAILWRDLELQAPQIYGGKPLRILDVGAGFGQIAIRLAKLGHKVVVNDLSVEMMAIAKVSAEKEGVLDKIKWHHCPLQELEEKLDDTFDLVLCHAVIEWLADPVPLLPRLKSFLSEPGVLSFTYYNRHSFEYRNLIRGNFNLLTRGGFVPDSGSLTPGNPLYPQQVQDWCGEAGLQAKAQSGIRVFHDYVTTPRGGNDVPKDIIEMELRYSLKEPYLWLGRYIHLLLVNSRML
jgi:S-adenosylmethionine-dependent methyltransferase